MADMCSPELNLGMPLLQKSELSRQQRQYQNRLDEDITADEPQEERTVRELVLDALHLFLAFGVLLGASYHTCWPN
jgi:hypothetical protein